MAEFVLCIACVCNFFLSIVYFALLYFFFLSVYPFLSVLKCVVGNHSFFSNLHLSSSSSSSSFLTFSFCCVAFHVSLFLSCTELYHVCLSLPPHSFFFLLFQYFFNLSFFIPLFSIFCFFTLVTALVYLFLLHNLFPFVSLSLFHSRLEILR